MLSGVKSGDVAEAKLTEGETGRAVKRRLTMAAKRRGQQLQYSNRAPRGTIIFRVKEI